MSDDRADQMREALEFYAAPETWCVSGDTHEGEVKAYRDGGAIARAALDASPPPSPVEDASGSAWERGTYHGRGEVIGVVNEILDARRTVDHTHPFKDKRLQRLAERVFGVVERVHGISAQLARIEDRLLAAERAEGSQRG